MQLGFSWTSCYDLDRQQGYSRYSRCCYGVEGAAIQLANGVTTSRDINLCVTRSRTLSLWFHPSVTLPVPFIYTKHCTFSPWTVFSNFYRRLPAACSGILNILYIQAYPVFHLSSVSIPSIFPIYLPAYVAVFLLFTFPSCLPMYRTMYVTMSLCSSSSISSFIAPSTSHSNPPYLATMTANTHQPFPLLMLVSCRAVYLQHAYLCICNQQVSGRLVFPFVLFSHDASGASSIADSQPIFKTRLLTIHHPKWEIWNLQDLWGSNA
jgi:hypothetical protein